MSAPRSTPAAVWVQTCAMQSNNVEGLDGPTAFADQYFVHLLSGPDFTTSVLVAGADDPQ